MNESSPGTKTILFTDVEGSTGFRTRVGDDAAHDVLRQHEERVRELIERHGGREVKSLGDGFMAAFVSARSAVDCAVSVQRAFEAFADEGLRVRVGINAGDVREEAGDLYGTAVHAASRIAAAANGRQILISGVVKDLAGTMPGVQFVDAACSGSRVSPRSGGYTRSCGRSAGSGRPRRSPSPSGRRSSGGRRSWPTSAISWTRPWRATVAWP